MLSCSDEMKLHLQLANYHHNHYYPFCYYFGDKVFLCSPHYPSACTRLPSTESIGVCRHAWLALITCCSHINLLIVDMFLSC